MREGADMALPLSMLSLFQVLGRGLAACAIATLAATSAQALALTSFRDQGLDHIFGSYAPHGDCSREPRVVIDETGMSFRANGRDVKPPRVEYALSFMGPSYSGIMAVFFPFPVSASDLGRVLMFVNDGERRGFIRFEADLLRGQRPDPFHAAFTDGGLFMRCKGWRAGDTQAPPWRATAVRYVASWRIGPGLPACPAHDREAPT